VRTGVAAGAKASGLVTEVQYFGAFTRIKVDVSVGAGAVTLQADLPEGHGRVAPAGGANVHLHWDDGAVHALREGSPA
jgi:putative spermidine/putrescine transport system ATP-binding protein